MSRTTRGERLRCDLQELLALTPINVDHAIAPTEAKPLIHVSAFSVRILGGLKVGKKKLFVYHSARLHELTPDCVCVALLFVSILALPTGVVTVLCDVDVMFFAQTGLLRP